MNKKLVLEERDGGVLAGISQKDCDPQFSSFPSRSLADLLMQTAGGVSVLAGFVAVAETKWATNPKAPKYVAPKTALPTSVTAKKEAERKTNAKTQKPSSQGQDKEITSEVTEPSSGTPQLPLLDVEEEIEARDRKFREEHPEDSEQLPESISTDGSIAIQNPAKGYFLKDGSGPFADIQLAMDALGMPKDKRPTHKRYSRLSADLREKIIDKTK